jgi:hypothetical protein
MMITEKNMNIGGDLGLTILNLARVISAMSFP